MAILKTREQKAKLLLKEGKYREALLEYQSLVSEDPDNPNSYNILGDIYKVLKLNEDAINSYKEAIEIYTKETLYNNAVALCKKILRISPDEVEVYNTLGKLYSELELQGEALENFIEYANRMRRKNNIEQVIKTYEYIKEKFPDNQPVRNELQELYLLQGIEKVKKLGPLKKIEETSAPAIEKVSPALSTSYLTQAISLIKGESVIEEPVLKEEEFVEPELAKDKLTGLYDRNTLLNSLEENIEIAERENTSLSLFFIDINHFKSINEKIGEESGDKILLQLVEILRNNSTEKDLLFRYDGDEFAILSQGISKQESITKQENIKNLIETFKFIVPLQIKISFAIYPEDAKTSNLLLEQAYSKLKQARPGTGKPGTGKPGKEYKILHCSQIVGREEELHTLEDLLKQAGKPGTGKPGRNKQASLGTVFISGEPGIGKTRLLWEFAERSKFKGIQIFTTSCSIPATPYAPFKSLLKQYLEAKNRSFPAPVQPILAQILPLFLPEASEKTSLHHRQAWEKDEVFNATLNFLITLSQEAPVLFIIKNLELAAESTIELLAYITQNFRDFNGIICCSFHNDFRKKAESQVVGTTTIELKPFSEKDIETAISLMLKTESPDPEIIKTAKKISKGNPFLLEEILSGNQDWEVLPTDMNDAIENKINMLDEVAQEILSISALMGDEFESDFLSVVSNKNEGYLSGVLDKAEELEIIKHLRNTKYTFTHPEIRNVFESRVKSAPTLHKKIGELMEVYYGMRIDELLWNIFYHFAKSTDASKAISYGIWAGDEAKKIYAYREALNYYNTALEKAKESQIKSAPTIYNSIIDTYLAMEDYKACEEQISLLEEKQASLGTADKANVALRKGVLYMKQGKTDDAISQLLEANKVHRKKGEKPFMLEEALMLGELYKTKEAYDETLKFLQEGLVLAEELEKREELGIILLLAGNVCQETKRFNEAFDYYSRVLSIFKNTGDKLHLSATLTNIFNLPLDWSKIGLLIQRGNIIIET